jgi:hypothetical protein
MSLQSYQLLQIVLRLTVRLIAKVGHVKCGLSTTVLFGIEPSLLRWRRWVSSRRFEETTFLWNVGNNSPNDTASYPRSPDFLKLDHFLLPPADGHNSAMWLSLCTAVAQPAKQVTIPRLDHSVAQIQAETLLVWRLCWYLTTCRLFSYAVSIDKITEYLASVCGWLSMQHELRTKPKQRECYCLEEGVINTQKCNGWQGKPWTRYLQDYASSHQEREIKQQNYGKYGYCGCVWMLSLYCPLNINIFPFPLLY